MKKEDIASYIVYLIMIVVAILLALYVINPMFTDVAFGVKFSGYNIVYGLVAIVVSVIVNAIVYELMHLLGAKIGHYDFVSINILGFNFYKLNNKIKFRFKGFDGLTGETIVSPRYNEKLECISKPKAMLWLANLSLIIMIIINYVVFALFYNNGKPYMISPIFMIALIVSAFMLFYNFLPLKLDTKTDGYQLRLISNKANISAFNELLRVKSCEVSNTDPGETKIFEDITDYTAEINMVSYYNYLQVEDYANALKVLELNLKGKDKISDTLKIRLEAHKIFILLFTNEITKAKKYYEEEISQEDKRVISNSSMMECIRAYVLISGIIDISEGEVQYATSRVDSAFKKVEALRKPIEKKLYIAAVNKVKELHPKWTPIVENSKETVKKNNIDEE